MNRIDMVRAAYERFNERDFEGVLELCDPEIEFRDLLGEGGTAHGRDAVRRRWAERYAEAGVNVTVGDVIEIGGNVIAAVCYQAYDRDGTTVGPYLLVTDQFSFRDEKIARIEATKFGDVPDEVRALLDPPEPPGRAPGG